MKDEELEPCMGCTPSDLQIILELQREVCDYERFCADLLFDLRGGHLHDHLRYNAPLAGNILDRVEKLLSKCDNKTTN